MKIPFFDIHILKGKMIQAMIDRVSAQRAIALRRQNAEVMDQNVQLAHTVNELRRKLANKVAGRRQ